tara:strand:- start:211 stop:564 length:354 start_codon:yes stop_codon:yes gene_type:complete
MRDKRGTWTLEFIQNVREACKRQFPHQQPTAPQILAVARSLEKNVPVEPKAMRKPLKGGPRSLTDAYNIWIDRALEGLQVVKIAEKKKVNWSKTQLERFEKGYNQVLDRVAKLKKKN